MSDLLITSIMALIFSVISGIVLHLISKQSKRQEGVEKQLKENTEAIVALKTTSVSDAHVRHMLKEEIQPMSETLSIVLTSLRDIQMSLAERKGFEAAQQLYSKRKTDNQDNQ